MAIRMRQPYLRHAYFPGIAGTHIEDINIKDPIMDFFIRFGALNGATSNIGNSMIDVLKKISIVDGSDILWALDAEEILANQLYHYKESTDFGIDERPSKRQETTFKIPLGIGRMHPEVAFDPTRFANPQLILEWDLEEIRALGADGFAVAHEFEVDIMADVIDEAPAKPTGYLMTKEITSYTSEVGEHRVELPVDHAYRTLYVRGFLAAKCPDVLMEWAKHSINEDKYRPFDIYFDDWVEWLKEWYGLWHQGMWYFLPDTTPVTKNPYLRGNLAASLEAMTADTDILLTSLDNCELNMTGANLAAEHIHAKVHGAVPFETFAWPYGDPETPEEWLQFTSTDKSRLHVDCDVADGDISVFLTQHRMY